MLFQKRTHRLQLQKIPIKYKKMRHKKTPKPFLPANIRLNKDVLKTSWRRLLSSSSENVLIKTNMFALALRLQKTSWRRLGQDHYICLDHMSSRRPQDVFKTSCKDIFKTFSRRTIRVNCLPRSHLWEIYGQCTKFVSVLKLIKLYHNSMVLVFHFTGT